MFTQRPAVRNTGSCWGTRVSKRCGLSTGRGDVQPQYPPNWELMVILPIIAGTTTTSTIFVGKSINYLLSSS